MSCPIPVLYVEFDFLQFDLKSTNFEDPKKTSNKIRRIVFSVIDVIYHFYFRNNSKLNKHFIALVPDVLRLQLVFKLIVYFKNHVF